MPRRIRNLVTACRAIRQAVTIYAWLMGAYVRTAERLGRWTTSITLRWVALCHWCAAVVTKPAGGNAGKPIGESDKSPSGKSRRRGSIIGFLKSRRVDRTFRTRRKLSSELSNTSGASADSPRCSSSSITIRHQDHPRGAGCSKQSAGWYLRTSIKGASRNPSRYGRTMNWNLNSKPDSSKR